jgi:hypothetical protein
MTALDRLAQAAEEVAKIEIDGPDGYEVATVTNWPEVVLTILNRLGTIGKQLALDAQDEH